MDSTARKSSRFEASKADRPTGLYLASVPKPKDFFQKGA
jgi:hypothetical protein